MILGLTGGIATGKSTVSKLFAKEGITVLDSDLIAHDLMKKDREAYKKIVSHFKEDILDEEKEIDRRKLSKIVFNNYDELKHLNRIVHPLVRKFILSYIRKSEEKLIVLDVPLLFEAKFDEICDKILVVSCSYEKQIKRIMERNNITEKEAILRINSQMPLNKKISKASFVIDNSYTLSDLEKEFSKLYALIKEMI